MSNYNNNFDSLSSQKGFLIFDIETVPDPGLIKAKNYPESSLSPQECVEKFKSELLEKSQGKSDFIPLTYHLPISLAFIKADAEGNLLDIGTIDRPNFAPFNIVSKFWQAWKKNQPTMVTFNGRGFDLPVLEVAAFRYGLSIPEWFAFENTPSYNQPRNRFNPQKHFDLMEFFTSYGSFGYNGGLDLAATLIGKPGKMNVSGAKVESLYLAGKLLEIDDYCICDALDTYFVFLRTRVLTGKITIEREKEIVDLALEKIRPLTSTYSGLEEYLDHFKFWTAPTENTRGFLDDSTHTP